MSMPNLTPTNSLLLGVNGAGVIFAHVANLLSISCKQRERKKVKRLQKGHPVMFRWGFPGRKFVSESVQEKVVNQWVPTHIKQRSKFSYTKVEALIKFKGKQRFRLGNKHRAEPRHFTSIGKRCSRKIKVVRSKCAFVFWINLPLLALKRVMPFLYLNKQKWIKTEMPAIVYFRLYFLVLKHFRSYYLIKNL